MTPDVRFQVGGPWSELVVAINQYVATGDYVGVCNAAQDTDRGALQLIFPVDQKNPTDAADMAKLKGRLDEIAAAGGAKFELRDLGMHGTTTYRAYLLDVGYDEIEALTAELNARPAAAGWGSPKPEVDKYRNRKR